MKRGLFYIAFAAFLLQNTEIKAQRYSFLKNDGKMVNTKDSADYVRVIGAQDATSKLYPVTDYYVSGKMKTRGYSSDAEAAKFEGMRVAYFETGKKQSTVDYKNGNVAGTAYFFYPNGNIYYAAVPDPQSAGLNHELLVETAKDSTGAETVTGGNGYFIKYGDDFKKILKEGNLVASRWHGEVKGSNPAKKISFIENFEHGKLISGVSTDENGKSYQYKSYLQPPMFKGGMTAFRQYLAYTIKYPQNVDAQINGTIITSFVVDVDGKLVDIETTQSLHPDFDAVVRNVISKSPKWSPGLERGIPARFKMSVPMTSQIR